MAPHKRHAVGDEINQGSKKRSKVIAPVSSRTTRSAARTTRSNNRDSTFDAVLLTTELLENILKSLPMKDLLLAQRVSRKWKAVITQSKVLQQTLFFALRPADFCWEFDPHSRRKWPKRVDSNHKLPAESQDLVLLQHCQVNPMVFDTVSEMAFGTSQRDVYTDCVRKSVGAMIEPHILYPVSAVSFPQASWRRMLFTQTPIQSLHWRGRYNALHPKSRGSMLSKEYITCGKAVEKVVGVFGGRYSAETLTMSIYTPDMILSPPNELAVMVAEQDVLISEEAYNARMKLFRFLPLNARNPLHRQ